MGIFRSLFGWLFGPDPMRDQYKQERRQLKDQLKSQKISKQISKQKLKEAKYNYKTKKVELEIKRLTQEKQTLLSALASAGSTIVKAKLARKVESIVNEIAAQEERKRTFQRDIIDETRRVEELNKEKLRVLQDEMTAEVRVDENIKKEGIDGVVDQDVHGGVGTSRIQQEVSATKQNEVAEEDLERKEGIDEREEGDLVRELRLEASDLEVEAEAEDRNDAAAALQAETEVGKSEQRQKQKKAA